MFIMFVIIAGYVFVRVLMDGGRASGIDITGI